MSNPEINEPTITLRFDEGAEFVLTPHNATLYTFLGHTALESGDTTDNAERNHVFLRWPDEDNPEDMLYRYLFGRELVQQLGTLMLNKGFPAVLNKREVPDYDEQSYQTYLRQLAEVERVPDELPDWLQ